METKKSKVFTKKVIALFLAVVMAVGTLMSTFAASAYQKKNYYDNNLASNLLAWVDATDDQTIEALADYLDAFLAEMNWDNLNKKIKEADIDSKIPSGLKSYLTLNITNLPYVYVQFKVHVIVDIINVKIEGYVNSVDGIINVLFQLKSALSTAQSASGIAKFIGYDISTIANIPMETFGKYFYNSTKSASYADTGYMLTGTSSWRQNNSGKYILRGVLRWVIGELGDYLIKPLLDGTLDLSVLDIYSMDLITDALGVTDYAKDSKGNPTWNTDPVYNVLKVMVTNALPDIYGDEDHMNNNDGWNWDTEGFRILNYYVDKLSFNITYPERVLYTADMGFLTDDGEPKVGWYNDCSQRRYQEIQKYAAAKGVSFDSAKATVSAANGWDANLVYSTEGGYEGNVLISHYGTGKAVVKNTDTIYGLAWLAFQYAWKTALKPTLELVHVNYNGHESSSTIGTNFDNHFYYWMVARNGTDAGAACGWNYNDWKSNYTKANVMAWAADVYDDVYEEGERKGERIYPDVTDAEDFYNKVGETFVYDRAAKSGDEAKYNWRDIDSSKLFNETRYSPLADLVYDVQTGPLNLYFEQTGADSLINWIDSKITYSNGTISSTYSGLFEALNDAAVQAMAVLFPESENIGYTAEDGTVTSTSLTGLTEIGNSISAPTLVANAATVFQYAADATDVNILNPYYHNNDTTYTTAKIDETNFEEAVVPFAISALKHWSLTASIHDSDWDKVIDIESMAVVALNEYLEYVFPDRDYSTLWKEDYISGKDSKYKYVQANDGKDLLLDAIVPMAGDAIGFVLTAAGVPTFTSTTCTKLWDPYTDTCVGTGSGLDNQVWTMLNSVVCYFALDAKKNLQYLGNFSGITASKTVWQNIDVLVNNLLPIIGTLQGKGAGKADSKQLLWNDIVLGISEMSSKKGLATDNYGLTNLVQILSNIFTSAPFKQKTVLKAVVFDLVDPLLEKLLGSRSSTTRKIITVAESTSDSQLVNTFLKKGYIVDGTIMNLLNNVYEALFNKSYDDTWDGICFILNALQWVPKLKDNVIGGVSVTCQDKYIDTTAVETYAELRNESWGFNKFYTKADGTIAQASRYDANIQSVKILDAAGTDVTSKFTITAQYGAKTGALAAEGLNRLKITGTATNNTLYQVVATYTMTGADVRGGSNTANYTATAVDYFYVSTSGASKAWSEAYSGNNINDKAVTAGTNNGIVNNTIAALKVPSLLVVGENASACTKTYNASSSTASTITTLYAAPKSGTKYIAVDENGSTEEATVDGTEGYAYLALDKAGYVVKADGSKALASALIANGTLYGYEADEDGNITAVYGGNDELSGYKLGTPIAGVYLEAGSEDIEKDSSANVRIISASSQSGLKPALKNMRLATSKGTVDMMIASGDIDAQYAAYKAAAAGYANNLATAGILTGSLKTTVLNAYKETAANGLNSYNISGLYDQLEDKAEALLAAATAADEYEVSQVVTSVIEARRDLHNVDYKKPYNYEVAVKAAKAAEDLLIAEPVYSGDVDEEGNKIQARDEDGYLKYTYTSYAPVIQIKEAVRLYTARYWPQVELRSYIGDVVEGEITHATSKCDDLDYVVAGTENYLANFTAAESTRDGASEYRFAYSTKDKDEKDDVKVYEVTYTGSNPLKFGAVKDGKLVNEGEKVYTEESWNAYVDALGECITAANAQDKVSATYSAKAHLVMAENNLEVEEPEEADGIIVSGKVLIASSPAADTGAAGARGIFFMVDGETVTDAEGNIVYTSSEAGHYGEFTITVPAGTTEILVTNGLTVADGGSTVDRTVTLKGDANVEGASIPIIFCDYNKDKRGTPLDKLTFNSYVSAYSASPSVYTLNGDLNDDNRVNALDKLAFNAFMINGAFPAYAELALD